MQATQLEGTDGSLYRASRIINSSESMREQTLGRHTGAMGTGVYCFRTRKGAEGYAEILNDRHSDSVIIHSVPEPLRPYRLPDSQAKEFHEFSQFLIGLAWKAKRVAQTSGLPEAARLQIDYEHSLWKATILAPISLRCSEQEVKRAVESTANGMMGKGFDEFQAVSQPINRLLRARGHDGVLVEPEGRFDTATYGSVYFVEDFAARFPGVLP